LDEVIVVFEREAPSISSPTRLAMSSVMRLAADAGGLIEPLFPAYVQAERTSRAAESEAARYASIVVGAESGEELARQFSALPEVETAYARRQPELPIAPFDERDVSYADLESAALRTVGVPDFRIGQGYLEASPDGVGVAAAWPRPGGRGDGVKIIDIEGGWCLTHIDLQPNDGLLAGTAQPGLNWRDHGTAVLGVLAGSDGPNGVTGIAPAARLATVAHGGIGAARAIEAASDRLGRGDIMVLEMHDAGPRFGFKRNDDQLGYIAMEWWPDIFVAITRAIARGIIVVEAAGNGAENLDDALYDIPHPAFPQSWRNPFSRTHDSGAILVGAGAPPGGAFGVDRSRLGFSNFGTRLDCQGWGRSVVTTGYGDLFQGANENEAFTRTFSGTSSASPIVAGTIACLQGIAKRAGRILDATQVRDLLRGTGAPQQEVPGAAMHEHIGTRPDLGQLLQISGL
jgi:subtilisin family serine protease